MLSHACCRWSCLFGGCLDQRFVEPRPSSRRLAVRSRNSPLGRKPSRSKCIFSVAEIIMPSLSVGISVACRPKQLQNTSFLTAFRHSRRSRTRFLLNYIIGGTLNHVLNGFKFRCRERQVPLALTHICFFPAFDKFFAAGWQQVSTLSTTIPPPQQAQQAHRGIDPPRFWAHACRNSLLPRAGHQRSLRCTYAHKAS